MRCRGECKPAHAGILSNSYEGGILSTANDGAVLAHRNLDRVLEVLPMIRIYRRFPKNSVRHWRAVEGHPASAVADFLLRPELIAGPYVLLADMVPARARASGSEPN